MQERIRHEDQTPMFLNGFSVPHAILVEPQIGLTVLIKGFNGPTLQIQGDDPLGTPIDAICYQHDIGARQLRTFEAHHQPDFAQPRQTHSEGKGPVGFVPHRHGTVRGGRDAGHQLFHGNVWPLQWEGFACCILEDEAVGLQIPVLLQQADPVFFVVAGYGHQLIGEIPTVEQKDAKRHFVPYGGLQQVNAQIDLRPKLLVQLLKIRVFQQDGIHFLMEARPCLFLGRNGTVGEVFVDELDPAGALFIAPIHTQIHRKTDRAADVMTGDGIVCEGICALAMVIMAIDIVEQTPDMLAQRVIEDQRCVSLRTAYGLRLLEQIRQPTVIDTVLEPWRFGEEAGEVRFVRTLSTQRVMFARLLLSRAIRPVK